MTKAELVNVVRNKTGMSKNDCLKTVDALIEAITEALIDGDKVSISGFGSFKVKTRAERSGINPQTKEVIVIESYKLPVFKAGKVLKESISGR